MADTENKSLEQLLQKTDRAFQQLMSNPACEELNHAYEMAKQDLDLYLVDMRNTLKQRYKDR